MIINPWRSSLNYEEIGSYKLGMLYSESFSGIPWESEINTPISVGRTDSKIFNDLIGIDTDGKPIFQNVPGGLQKTLRIIVLLHETSHFVHDLSLGTSMEIDYLTDSGLAALIYILQTLQKNQTIKCPIFDRKTFKQLTDIKELKDSLLFLKEREILASTLMHIPSDIKEYANLINPIFKEFPKEIKELSGIALMEGIVAVKTHIAISLRIKDAADANYLEENKKDIPLLPEYLPPIYYIARKLFDVTLGKMIGISKSYLKDSWPHSYSNSLRSISDEGFLYLADIALHIPPFEYSADRIKRGLNTWDDFIPAKRYIHAISTMLKRGHFPPLEDSKEPGQFYKTVFNFVANDIGWPTYEETSYMWMEKLKKYKELRQEATDGYRYRMINQKYLHPSEIVVADCFDACMKQFIPIIHLTPKGLKLLGGTAIGDSRYFTPFELPNMMPFYIMQKNFPLWKDLPKNASVEDLQTEIDNKQLFQQEIIYRIISIELKNAILYNNYFKCPLVNKGCNTAIDYCSHIKQLKLLPPNNCCIRFYAEQKNLIISKINW